MTLKRQCFLMAKTQASYSNVSKAKVAAIAFSKKGEVLAQAHNRLIGKPNKWSEHAEESLIKKLRKNRLLDKGVKILVVRMGKKGPLMAKPCVKCQKLILKYNIEAYYTSEDGTIKRL